MTENDEPCMCGTDFTCMADDHDHAVANMSGIQVDVWRSGSHVHTLDVVSGSVTIPDDPR